MKKQNKKSKQSLRWRLFGTHRRTAVSATIIVAVLVGGFFIAASVSLFISDYTQMRRQAMMEPIRGDIIRSVEQLSTVAPVDPKTGDVYLPPLKLKLPAKFDQESRMPTLRYSWDTSAKTLTVSDQSTMNLIEAKMYNAHDLNEMFGYVPELQACSAGVAFVPTGQEFSGWKIQGSIKPVGGTTRWELYINPGCPQNKAVADRLLGLEAY